MFKISMLSMSITLLTCLGAAHGGFAGVADESSPLRTWRVVGDATWSTAAGGALHVGRGGPGFLVSTDSFDDFELTVEFMPMANTNSGIFVRCVDPSTISDTTCYEANIFDHRPDQSGRTGGIVNVAPPAVSINTVGQWNTYEISAQGNHLVVKLNGVVTVDTYDEEHREGYIALQSAEGEIAFRNLSIRRGFDLERSLVGVWTLTRFDLDDGRGNIEPWCAGAFGTIMYFRDYMSVSINCTSEPSRTVFYSGPYGFENTPGHETVIHHVANFSDPGLLQVFRRGVVMADQNQLDLVGPFGDGGRAVVSWVRNDGP